MADILGAARRGAGPALVSGQRTPYAPLEAKYPRFADQIAEKREAGQTDEQIEQDLKTKVLDPMRAEGRSDRDIQEWLSVPSEPSLVNRAKGFARQLAEGFQAASAGGEASSQYRKGLSEGATLNWLEREGAPMDKQQWLAREYGKTMGGFLPGLGIGLGTGAVATKVGGTLIGPGATTAYGRGASALAEAIAGSTIQTGLTKPGPGQTTLGNIAGTLTDPLNLALTAPGVALGAAMKPRARTAAPEPPPAAAAAATPAPPAAGPQMEMDFSQPVNLPPTPVGEPTPTGIPQTLPPELRPGTSAQPAGPGATPAAQRAAHLSATTEVANLERQAQARKTPATTAQQAVERQRVAEAKKAEVIARRDSLNQVITNPQATEAELDRAIKQQNELTKQAEGIDQRIIDLTKSQYSITDGPKTTISLGSRLNITPDPSGSPHYPTPSTETILAQIHTDIINTGQLSPETEALINERGLTDRGFVLYGATRAIDRAHREWLERQQPTPVSNLTTGQRVARLVIKMFDDKIERPYLGNLTADEIRSAITYLREQIKGVPGRRYTDFEGRPMTYSEPPRGPVSEQQYKPSNARQRGAAGVVKGEEFKPASYYQHLRRITPPKAGAKPRPKSHADALYYLEQEATNRQIWEWSRVPVSADDINWASHLVHKGQHPERGHRVEVLRELPGELPVSLKDVWVPDDQWAGIVATAEGKIRYGEPPEHMTLEDLLKTKGVATIMRNYQASLTKPVGRGGQIIGPGREPVGPPPGRPTHSTVPAKPASRGMPSIRGLADFMRWSGMPQDLSVRILKLLLPPAGDDPGFTFNIIRNPDKVSRLDTLIESLRRQGKPVQDVINERQQFQGYTQDTYELFYPPAQEPPPPGVTAATPSGVTVRAADVERLRAELTAERAKGVAQNERKVEILENNLRAAEARARLGEDVTLPTGERIPPTYAPGERIGGGTAPAVKPATHRLVARDEDGKVAGTRDILGGEEEAQKLLADAIKLGKMYTENITFELEPIIPSSVAPEVTSPRGNLPEDRPGMVIRGERGRRTPSQRVEPKTTIGIGREGARTKVQAKPPEEVKTAFDVTQIMPMREASVDVKGWAANRGYKLVVQRIPGQPIKMILVGRGRHVFDTSDQVIKFLQSEGAAANADVTTQLGKGEKVGDQQKAQWREHQRTVKPQETQAVTPTDLEPEPPPQTQGEPGPTFGMSVGIPFAGVKVPGFFGRFMQPQALEGMAPQYGAFAKWLSMQPIRMVDGSTRVRTPSELIRDLRHINEVERQVPGTINHVLEAAQVRQLTDNPTDFIGNPMLHSNPVVRIVSRDAVFNHGVPKHEMLRREMEYASASYDHLTAAQDTAAYHHLYNHQSSNDPQVVAAANAFADWAARLEATANLPPNWYKYIRGIVDKQASFEGLQAILSPYKDWNTVPEYYQAWVGGEKAWNTFYRHVMSRDRWQNVPRDTRDIINDNFLRWDKQSLLTYNDLPKEIRDLIPQGVYHRFALTRGAPPVQSLRAFHKALIPEMMDAMYTQPFRDRWEPVFKMLPEDNGAKKWGRDYLNMIAGGAERSGWTAGFDNFVRGIEDSIGVALTEDNFLDNLAQGVSRRAYRALLGLGLDTAVRNMAGVTNSFMEYGPTRMGRGIRRVLAEPDFRQLYDETNDRTGIFLDVAYALHYDRPGVPRDGNFPRYLADKFGITRERLDMIDRWATKGAMAPHAITENLNRGMAMVAGMDEALAMGLDATTGIAMGISKQALVQPNMALSIAQRAAYERTLRTHFGHMLETQPLAYRNPLMRMSTMFWNYPGKLSQFISQPLYNVMRSGPHDMDTRDARFLILTGFLVGGVWLGWKMGLDLSRVVGASLIPTIWGPPMQMLTNLYTATLGDNPIPDAKWHNTVVNSIGIATGVPTRYPQKAIDVIESGVRGYVQDKYADPLYETSGYTEFWRAFGVECGDNYKKRELLRTISGLGMKDRIARRNAIGRYFQGDDGEAITKYNETYGEYNGSPITGDTVKAATKQRQTFKYDRLIGTPYGQKALEETGAVP